MKYLENYIERIQSANTVDDAFVAFSSLYHGGTWL